MTHGTRYAYRSGCRCDECRAWNARTQREKYARRQARRREHHVELPPDA